MPLCSTGVRNEERECYRLVGGWRVYDMSVGVGERGGARAHNDTAEVHTHLQAQEVHVCMCV